MVSIELTRKDWEILNSFGIVEGHGNGFANTTYEFKDLVPISKNYTYISIKGKQSIYLVQYIDGCFYPIWTKLRYTCGKTPFTIKQVGRIDGKLSVVKSSGVNPSKQGLRAYRQIKAH